LPKKRVVIEEAKKNKQDKKRLKESRKCIQIIILRKLEATTTSKGIETQEIELDLNNLSQMKAQL